MQERDLESSQQERAVARISRGWKGVLVGALGGIALFALYRIIRYSLLPDAKPSDAGLLPLLGVSVAALVLVVVPLERFGLRLKKFGGLEFERVLNAQKAEQITEVVYLQRQIDELKSKLESTVEDLEPPSEEPQESTAPIDPDALEKLLRAFFSKYAGWYFNPSRIREWGSVQPGFSNFNDYSIPEIKAQILAMVEGGFLKTKISRRGSTLFGLLKHA